MTQASQSGACREGPGQCRVREGVTRPIRWEAVWV